MKKQFHKTPDSGEGYMLVKAAVRFLKDAGLAPRRRPGRGRSNMWEIEEGGERKRVAIRTTRNRWFAFPPVQNGAGWKTLDGMDVVIVAALDDCDNPQAVEVFRFDAGEVRRRFDAAYAARIEAGHVIKDGFGMWVNLDKDERDAASSVGSGLAEAYPAVARFAFDALVGESAEGVVSAAGLRSEGGAAGMQGEAGSIAEVMEAARRRIAALSGVPVDSVKLDCRIEV